MAFLKLLPREGHSLRSVASVVSILRGTFMAVEIDRERGQEHVADMIAAVSRFSDSLPHKQPMLKALESVQAEAVYAYFGDAEDEMAGCCILPDDGLFFDGDAEIGGRARLTVERAAKALGYVLHEG